MRELSPLLEEIIASGGVAELTVTGRSMEQIGRTSCRERV